MRLYQVAAAGGETLPIPVPLPNINVFSLSTDHSSMLVSEFNGGMQSSFWSLPVPSGSLRRLGGISGSEGVWSPDSPQLAFVSGRDLYLAAADGTHPRQPRTFADFPNKARFSMDGKRLRFSLKSEGTNTSSLWEMRSDGSHLRPLLPGWRTDAMQCYGDWTSDGRYYFFEVQGASGSSDLWALRESQGLLQRATPP